MALIKCPECNREVSDRAASCPHCGCPLNSTASQAPQSDFVSSLHAKEIPHTNNSSSRKRPSKRKVNIFRIAIAAASVAVLAFAIVLFTAIIPNNQYNEAVELLADGSYDEAITAFEKLGSYRDSGEQLSIAQTEKDQTEALALLDKGKYEEAYPLLQADEDLQEIIVFENAVAFCCADYYPMLKNPDSFQLREVWFESYERNSGIPSIVLQTAGTNSYGGIVTSYELYTWNNDSRSFSLFNSVSDLDDEKDSDYDDSEERLDKSFNNLTRTLIRLVITDDDPMNEKIDVKRINRLFEDGFLEDMPLMAQLEDMNTNMTKEKELEEVRNEQEREEQEKRETENMIFNVMTYDTERNFVFCASSIQDLKVFEKYSENTITTEQMDLMEANIVFMVNI